MDPNQQQPQSIPTAPPTPPVESQAQQVATPSSQPPQPASPKKTMILLGGIVVLVLVVGVFAFLILNKQSETQTVTPPPIQTIPTAIPPSPTPQADDSASAIEAIDTGDPTTDLQTIETDVQSL